MVYEKVPKLTNVSIELLKKHPPALIVHAEGIVPTSGWSQERLRRISTTGGKYEYDFEAVRPTDATLQVIMPVFAADIIDPIPDNINTIVVNGKDKSITIDLADAGKVKDKAMALSAVTKPRSTPYTGEYEVTGIADGIDIHSAIESALAKANIVEPPGFDLIQTARLVETRISSGGFTGRVSTEVKMLVSYPSFDRYR